MHLTAEPIVTKCANQAGLTERKLRCEMWTNGITWHDACGVSTYVEVKDLKTVMLFVSFVKGR